MKTDFFNRSKVKTSKYLARVVFAQRYCYHLSSVQCPFDMYVNTSLNFIISQCSKDSSIHPQAKDLPFEWRDFIDFLKLAIDTEDRQEMWF